MQVTILNALKDNYIYLIQDPATKITIVIDPSEAEPVEKWLKENGKRLDYILCTHHHADHVGGNLALKAKWNAQIIGPKNESRIPAMDMGIEDGQTFHLGKLAITGLSVPGHTLGAMAFWLETEKILFTGDTLFLGGCGRLFEGTPKQMWQSLSRLKKLPADTQIYCGHEYTVSNLAFALTLDPENIRLKERTIQCHQLRQKGLPTVPASMEVECATNPFLRADKNELQEAIGMKNTSPERVFAFLRKKKDQA